MNDKFDKNGLIAKFRNQFKTPQQKAIEAKKGFQTIEDKISDTVKEINCSINLIKNVANENKPIREKIAEFINDFEIHHHEDSEYYYTDAYSPSTKENISLKSNRHYKLGALLAEILIIYFNENGKLKYQMTNVVKNEILNELKIIESEGHSNNLKYKNSEALIKNTKYGFEWRNTDKDSPKEQQFLWNNLKNALTKPKKEIKDKLNNLNIDKH